MVIFFIQPHHVPRMAILHAPFGVIFRQSNDTPNLQCITKNLNCLCNTLTNANAMPQNTDDFMGILLFQLIIAYIFADKIVDIQ